MPEKQQAEAAREKPALPVAALAAIGVVYGDLGTSPLYTMQTVVKGVGGHVSADGAIGILSLLLWTLVLSISVKYCLLVMRADNHGEGGILALMSLIGAGRGRRIGLLGAMGLFGAALIYGDGIVTPAISVLSALEGLEVATKAVKPAVLPLAAVVLVALFAAQKFGTARIGRVFGPVMALWFVTIAVIGLSQLLGHPGVLRAADPLYAVDFLLRHGAMASLVVLGGVFLAITGGEALYADMGHVGRFPIRLSWYGIVLPALLLSYAGQTALLVGQAKPGGNPFFLAAPGWALYPLVVLATMATVIASQAIITGAFSLTRQAMQLGWLPGLSIRQTSDREYGQIYVPFVNWTMMICTLGLTLGFGSSDRLAGAYGSAVSTTMLLTTVLLYRAMRDCWKWGRIRAGAIAGVFLVMDTAFFAANMLKVREGGYIPLLLGAVLFILMTSWHRGVAEIRAWLTSREGPPEAFFASLHNGALPRVHGTAVFLTRANEAVPLLMIRHAEQFGALQERVISLAVVFEQVPRVAWDSRVEVTEMADGLWRIVVHFGFVEMPSLSVALRAAREAGCPVDPGDAIYFGAHDEIVRAPGRRVLPGWQRMLFAVMHRNAVHAPETFDLPRDRFLEIGRQIEL